MPKFKYEIEYYFQVDKNDAPRVHWMYVEIEARTIASSKTKALEHYNRQTRECGWTKYCTLNEIRPLRKGNDPPHHKSNTDLSDTRKPVKSSPRKPKPAARNTKRDGSKGVGKTTRRASGTAKPTGAKAKPVTKKPTTRKKK